VTELLEARLSVALVPEDRAMLRAAAELTRDLQAHNALHYWADFLGSAALGYAAAAAAVFVQPWWLAAAAGLVAVLALYRATLFIHEVTHLEEGRLPGFRLAWNLVIGVPTLLPSFLYEGIHIVHHSRTRYGTAEDPEYLPLALMRPWTLPLFVLAALLMPFALLVRFGVLGPLSLLSRRLRTLVVSRFSGLQINPRYVRRAPEGAFARRWFWQELGASLVAISILAALASGLLPLRDFLIVAAILSGVALLNQLRTLVAHLWRNEGESMTLTAQFLDSTNVPNGVLPYLWAPVGLRFHALHHLLPSLPYHALTEAHRRISAALDDGSAYRKASYGSLHVLVRDLATATFSQR
jgi:fatty acid desaturase